MERDLLATFVKSREAFDEITKKYGEEGSSFSDLGKILFRAIKAYYERDVSAQSVDLALLATQIESSLRNEKHFALVQACIKGLPNASVPNVRDAYIAQRKAVVGQELSVALIKGDDKIARTLSVSWNELDSGVLTTTQDSEEVFENTDINTLLAPLERKNLIRLYPLSITERTDGGAVLGDHIVISGRVENGKSLVAINMACGFAHDGHRVLYIGNEDAPQRMLPRFVSRFSGLTKSEVLRDPTVAKLRAERNGWSNLVFVSQPPGTSINSIEALVERYSPKILVVDQLRNINVGTSDLTEQLERAALGMRTLTKRHKLLGVSVTQSNNGPDVYNKLVGEMCDVSDSKVGIPGQADLILMLGTNEEYRSKNQVMISVVKNKLSGFHGYFPVQTHPQLSKVEDMV